MHSEPIKEVTLETHPLPAVSSPRHHEIVSSQLSRESDKTVSQASNSNSSDSDRTPVRLDSQDSQISDTDTLTDGHMARQNSVCILYKLSIW